MQLTPDESWPKMERQLDRYYAGKRRKRAAWFLLGIVFLGTLAGYWYGNTSESVTMNGSEQMVSGGENAVVTGNSTESTAASSDKTMSSTVPVVAEPSVSDAGTVTASSNSSVPNSNRRDGDGRTAAVPVAKVARSTTSSRSTYATSVQPDDSRIGADPATPSAGQDFLTGSSQAHEVQGQPVIEANAGSEPKQDAVERTDKTEEVIPVPDGSVGTITAVEPAVPVSVADAKAADNTPSAKDSTVAESVASTVIPASNSVKDSSLGRTATRATRAIEISYGRYVRSRTLSSSDPLWNQRRIDEEELLIPQSFSVVYSHMQGNWSMGLGLEYWKLGESTYYSGNTAYDSILDNSYYTYQVDSLDTLYLSGNQVIFRDGFPDVLDSTYNQLIDTLSGTFIDPSLVTRNGIVAWSLVQVPVRFGYSVGSGRWAFTGQVSLSPGLLTGVKGRYLDGSMTRLVDAKQLATVRRFQLAASFGLRLEYRFGNAWSIMAGPDWRRQFTSMYNKQSGVDQRYSPWGLSAGVRLRLGAR